jgi:hypothetical protein
VVNPRKTERAAWPTRPDGRHRHLTVRDPAPADNDMTSLCEAMQSGRDAARADAGTRGLGYRSQTMPAL